MEKLPPKGSDARRALSNWVHRDIRAGLMQRISYATFAGVLQVYGRVGEPGSEKTT